MHGFCLVLNHPHVASGLGDDPHPQGGFCIGEQLDGELYGTSSMGLYRPGLHPGSRGSCGLSQYTSCRSIPHTIIVLSFSLQHRCVQDVSVVVPLERV